MEQKDSAAYSEALRFLVALDQTTTKYCFQIFDDLKIRQDRRLAATFSDTLENRFEYLTRMNSQGAGIFVCANSIKPGCARKIEYLERVRAVWQDDDDGFVGSYPVLPTIITRTSFPNFQRIWCGAGLTADLHQGIQRRLIQDYGSDPNAHDLVRVFAARIAAVLQVFDDPEAEAMKPEYLARGIELAEFYANEALRLQSASRIGMDLRDAERLRLWLIDRWSEPYVTIRAIQRGGPGSLREKNRIEQLLHILEAHNWVAQVSGITVEGKPTRTAWAIWGKAS
jgi:hypothetical protein